MAMTTEASSGVEMITSAMMDALTTTTSATSGGAAAMDDGMEAVVRDGMKRMADKATLVEELNFVMCAVVAPIVCFVGMAGNLLSIITWNRPKMRSSTGRYLTGQAIADFTVLLFFVLIHSVMAWNPDVKYSPAFGFFFCYIGYPCIFFAVVCSVWFTVGVTIDRYILVCWITKAKQYCNEKRANFGLLLITFNAFIINFPHYLSFKPADPNGGTDTNTTSSSSTTTNITSSAPSGGAAARIESFQPTDFYNGDAGQFYEFWIHCMILILIPWFTVFSMNVMIIRAVSKSNKKNAGKKTSASVRSCKQSENQITRLLLTVTFTFLFFIGIQCVVQCMFMKRPKGFNMFVVDSTFAIAQCGIVFNSSLNFFLYCLTGKRFRAELLKVLGMRDSDDQVSSLVDRPSGSGSSSKHTTSSTGSTGI